LLQQRAVGLLLWALQASDIDRLLQRPALQHYSAQQQMRGSGGMFIADVGS